MRASHTAHNILFLMTDQQRWDAMGCSGGWVNTPNLDRIAGQGVRFSSAVTTSPLCVPARVTLATGRYPHNNGVWGHIPFSVPAHADHWIREIRNLGYRTSLFGKRICTPTAPRTFGTRKISCMLWVWMMWTRSVALAPPWSG